MKENLKNRREAAKIMKAAADDHTNEEESKESAKGMSNESMSTAS